MKISSISRSKSRERRGKTSERIKKISKKFITKQLEQENKRFEASKITVDKFGMVSKKVHYEYDNED